MRRIAFLSVCLACARQTFGRPLSPKDDADASSNLGPRTSKINERSPSALAALLSPGSSAEAFIAPVPARAPRSVSARTSQVRRRHEDVEMPVNGLYAWLFGMVFFIPPFMDWFIYWWARWFIKNQEWIENDQRASVMRERLIEELQDYMRKKTQGFVGPDKLIVDFFGMSPDDDGAAKDPLAVAQREAAKAEAASQAAEVDAAFKALEDKKKKEKKEAEAEAEADKEETKVR